MTPLLSLNTLRRHLWVRWLQIGVVLLWSLFPPFFTPAPAAWQPDPNTGEPVWHDDGDGDEPPEGPDLDDSDEDGLPNWFEQWLGTSPYNPDTDYDGISDYDELYLTGTNPLYWDTNGDGYSDHDAWHGCWAVNHNVMGFGYSVYDWDGDGWYNPEDPWPFDADNGESGEGDGDGEDEGDGEEGEGGGEDGEEGDEEGGEGEDIDSDGDGVVDAEDSHPDDWTLWNDWDDNGVNDEDEEPDPWNTDSDGDGVMDAYDSHPDDWTLWNDWDYNGINDEDEEDPGDDPAYDPWSTDSDGDDVVDAYDSHPYDPLLWNDHNGNGVNDEDEDPWNTDSDGDNVMDAEDSHPSNSNLWNDWDYNGINDDEEGGLDPDADEDGDGVLNGDDSHPYDSSLWSDWDYDELNAEDEVEIYGTNPNHHDSDGDGLKDGEEIAYGTNPLHRDSDGDGLTDYEELRAFNSNPLDKHSLLKQRHPLDWPSRFPYTDWELADTIDSDGDGIPDLIEEIYGLNPNNPADAAGDLDADGVSNLAAWLQGLVLYGSVNPLDRDGDGITDIKEDCWNSIHPGILSKFRFKDAVEDADGDGLMNYAEILLESDPGNPASKYANVGDLTAWIWHVSKQQAADGKPFTLLLPDAASASWNTQSWAAETDGNGDGILDGLSAFLAEVPLHLLRQRAAPADFDGDGMVDAWEHRFRSHLDPMNTTDAGTIALIPQPPAPPVGTDFLDAPEQYAAALAAYPALLAAHIAQYGKVDPDLDGLSNLREYQLGTHPLLTDSYRDGEEILLGAGLGGEDSGVEVDLNGLSTPGMGGEWDWGQQAQVPDYIGSLDDGQPAVRLDVVKTIETRNWNTHPDEGYDNTESSAEEVTLPELVSWTGHETIVPPVTDEVVVGFDPGEPTTMPAGTCVCGLCPDPDSPNCEIVIEGEPIPITETIVIEPGYSFGSSNKETLRLQIRVEQDPEKDGIETLPANLELVLYVQNGVPGASDGSIISSGPLTQEIIVLPAGQPLSQVLTVELTDPNTAKMVSMDPDCSFARYIRDQSNETGLLSFTLTGSDSSGSAHRRIGLNGMPVADAPPAVDPDAKENPVETYVDAFSQSLHHSERDILLRLPGSLLTLQVRRDLAAETWSSNGGHIPGQRPDRPFGAGWTSNLAARVHIKDYKEAEVIDETGAVQKFVMADDGTSWIPTLEEAHSVLTRRHHLVTLGDGPECRGAIFTRPDGTICVYESCRLNQVEHPYIQHAWLRLVLVEDRYGNQMRYYHPEEKTLVPAAIAAVGRPDQAIHIKQDERGLVTAVRAPDGTQTTYEYQVFSGGKTFPSPLNASGEPGVFAEFDQMHYSSGPIHWLRSATTAGAVTQYEFEAWEEEDPTPRFSSNNIEKPRYHCVLAALTNALGQRYSFSHQWNHSVLYWDMKEPETEPEPPPPGEDPPPGFYRTQLEPGGIHAPRSTAFPDFFGGSYRARFGGVDDGEPPAGEGSSRYELPLWKSKLQSYLNSQSDIVRMVSMQDGGASSPVMSSSRESFQSWQNWLTQRGFASQSATFDLNTEGMAASVGGFYASHTTGRFFAPPGQAQLGQFFGVGTGVVVRQHTAGGGWPGGSSGGALRGRFAATPLGIRPFMMADRHFSAGANAAVFTGQQGMRGFPGATGIAFNRMTANNTLNDFQNHGQLLTQLGQAAALQLFSSANSLAAQSGSWRVTDSATAGTSATRGGPFASTRVSAGIGAAFNNGSRPQSVVQGMMNAGTDFQLWNGQTLHSYGNQLFLNTGGSAVGAWSTTAGAAATRSTAAAAAAQSAATRFQQGANAQSSVAGNAGAFHGLLDTVRQGNQTVRIAQTNALQSIQGSPAAGDSAVLRGAYTPGSSNAGTDFLAARHELGQNGAVSMQRRQLGLPPLLTAIELPNGRVTRLDSVRAIEIDPAGEVIEAELSVTATVDCEDNAAQEKPEFTWNFSQPRRHMQVMAYPPQSAAEVMSSSVVLSFEQLDIVSPAGTETFLFNFEAGMAVSSVTDLSGNVTEYDYNSEAAQPTSVMNALGEVTRFEYAPDSLERRLTKTSDGIRIERVLEALSGLTLEEKTFDADDNLVRHEVLEYEDSGFPAFVTKRTLKRLPGDPDWAVDLVTAYIADAWGRVAQEIVDPDGLALTTSHGYDIMGRPTVTYDPRGHVTTREYDALGHLIRISHPDCGSGPESVHRAYDALGNLVSETNERGVTTWHDYDALNRRVLTTLDANANGAKDGPGQDAVTATTCNGYNLPLTVTGPRGVTTVHVYDAIGRLVSETAASGLPETATTTYEYGANSGGSVFDRSVFKATRQVDPAGRVTETEYDALYRPVAVSKTDGGITSTQYDVQGNICGVIDPLERRTLTVFDPLKRLLLTTFPDASSKACAYTGAGFAWLERDQTGAETRTEYDAAGRAVRVIRPEVADTDGELRAPVERRAYDAAGNVIAAADALGNVTRTRYDARNRPIAVISPPVYDPFTGSSIRPATLTGYDPAGNVIAVTDPAGAVTETVYDAANRPVEVRQPAVPAPGGGMAHPVTLTSYDLGGNILSVTDPAGRVTTNSYDALNRQTSTTDGAGITVSFGYDAVGNRTRVTDGLGRETTFTYDGLERVLVEQPPAGAPPTVFAYDEVNKLSRTDAAGRVTLYEHDDLNRLTKITWSSEATREYHYDPAGRITLVEESANPAGAVGYVYDALGRVVRESSNGLTHSHVYDLAGNRVATLFGGSQQVERRGYDSMGRLSWLVDAAGGATVWVYDAAGRVAARHLPNGHWVGLNYDAAGRLFISTTYRNSGQLEADILLEQTWDYDLAGNVRKQTEMWRNVAGRGNGKLRTTTMSYDGAQRLVSETVSDAGDSSQNSITLHSYDAANNRVGKTVSGGPKAGSWTYAYNTLNQLTGVTRQSGTTGPEAITHSYDANGNRVSQVEQAAGLPPQTTTYHWDEENRLIGVEQESQSSYAYSYDYRTRRIAILEGSGAPHSTGFSESKATLIVFRDGLSVLEYEGANETAAREDAGLPSVAYVRGPDLGGGVGGLIGSLRWENGAQPSAPSAVRYNISNGRGDVVAQSDASGTITWTASYEGFGKRPKETGSNADRQRANTKEEDPTGLLNEGFRYRDLETGVWLSRDPAGFVDGPNLYAYVRQNPWTKFDPHGLSEKDTQTINKMVDDKVKELGVVGKVASWVGADKALKSSLSSAHERMNAAEAAGKGRTLTTGEYIGGIAEGSAPAATIAAMAPAAAAGPLVLAKEGVAEVTGLPIGVDDAVKLVKNAPDLTKSLNKIVKNADDVAAKGGVKPFDVGTADALKARSMKGDGLDIHHAGQAHPMEQLVPGYDRATGPAIAVPRGQHQTIPTVQGQVSGTPRQQLSKDIRDLRNNTDAPNSSLRELIDLNKTKYPDSFSK